MKNHGYPSLYDLHIKATPHNGAAGFGGSFAPIVQYEKWEIHPVFPHFSYFRLCQNLSPNLLAPLCGAALKNIGVPRGTPISFYVHWLSSGNR